MSPGEFKAAFGEDPRQDDLHRVNCDEVGRLGHFLCGFCPDHTKPRFMCGCAVYQRTPSLPDPIVKQRLEELIEHCKKSDIKFHVVPGKP